LRYGGQPQAVAEQIDTLFPDRFHSQ
jgi:hypothetical protein